MHILLKYSTFHGILESYWLPASITVLAPAPEIHSLVASQSSHCWRCYYKCVVLLCQAKS